MISEAHPPLPEEIQRIWYKKARSGGSSWSTAVQLTDADDDDHDHDDHDDDGGGGGGDDVDGDGDGDDDDDDNDDEGCHNHLGPVRQLSPVCWC